MLREGPAVPGVTIYDVAARANVSISTASLALNGSTRVRAATRARVLQAADDLGYVPKIEAVIRARQRVGLVGVLAPFSSYPSYYRRLNGFMAELATGDLTVDTVIFDHASAVVAGSPLLASIPLTHRLDGLVVMGLPIDDLVAERIRTHALPTVLVDTARREFPSVVTDDLAGGRLVGERVLERGHKRVVFVGETKSSPKSPKLQGEWRLEGLKKAVGRRVRVDVRHVERHDEESARVLTLGILDEARPPTAFAAQDDCLAAGVLQALRERGLTPGSDVDVIGIDDSDLARPLGLTTVAQPFEESGAAAATIMREMLSGGQPLASRLELDVRLVVRSSG